MREGSRKIKKIHLSPWTELYGKLYGIFHDNHLIHVRIGYWMLSFPNGSGEAELLRHKLPKLVGRKVGILKTDLPSNPLLVRVIE